MKAETSGAEHIEVEKGYIYLVDHTLREAKEKVQQGISVVLDLPEGRRVTVTEDTELQDFLTESELAEVCSRLDDEALDRLVY